jgi:hypothetical protein
LTLLSLALHEVSTGVIPISSVTRSASPARLEP